VIPIPNLKAAGPAYAELRRTRGLPPLGRQLLTLKTNADGPVRFALPDGAVYTAFIHGKPAPAAPPRR
jgi:hypothetical protein